MLESERSYCRLMPGTVNRAERNREEGNDTAFYYRARQAQINFTAFRRVSVMSWRAPRIRRIGVDIKTLRDTHETERAMINAFTMHSARHRASVSLTMYGFCQARRVSSVPQPPRPLTFSRTDSGSVFATFRGNKRHAGSTTVLCSPRRFIACTYRAFSRRARPRIARRGNAARAYQVP
jgi:hypothetical protein